MHLRQVFRVLGVIVLPSQVTVSHTYDAFTEDGAIRDPEIVEEMQEACDELIALTHALKRQ